MSVAADSTGVTLGAGLRRVDQMKAPTPNSAAAPPTIQKAALPEPVGGALMVCWRPPREFSHEARFAVSVTGMMGTPCTRFGSEPPISSERSGFETGVRALGCAGSRSRAD